MALITCAVSAQPTNKTEAISNGDVMKKLMALTPEQWGLWIWQCRYET
ncbi:MAG: hypothetical protein ACE5J9_10195 [Methanosarcinales archaeon]